MPRAKNTGFLSRAYLRFPISGPTNDPSPKSRAFLHHSDVSWPGAKGCRFLRKHHSRSHPSPSNPVVTGTPSICCLDVPWSQNHVRLSCLPSPSLGGFSPSTHHAWWVVPFPWHLHEVKNPSVRCVCPPPVCPAHHTYFSGSQRAETPDSDRDSPGIWWGCWLLEGAHPRILWFPVRRWNTHWAHLMMLVLKICLLDRNSMPRGRRHKSSLQWFRVLREAFWKALVCGLRSLSSLEAGAGTCFPVVAFSPAPFRVHMLERLQAPGEVLRTTVRGTTARATRNTPHTLPIVLSICTWFPQQYCPWDNITITKLIIEEIGMERLNYWPKVTHLINRIAGTFSVCSIYLLSPYCTQ